MKRLVKRLVIWLYLHHLASLDLTNKIVRKMKGE